MQRGRLKKWQDDKGFGFIQPDNSDEKVFVHISALQQMQRRPVLGDILHFNVAVDGLGRRKAVDVSIEGVKSVFSEQSFGKHERPRSLPKQVRRLSTKTISPGPKPKSRNSISTGFGWILLLVVIAAVKNGVSKFDQEASFTSVGEANSSPVEEQFQCAGKTHCSEMTSCQESKFYLNHCPGTVTDGDGDGIPCEDQWCGH